MYKMQRRVTVILKCVSVCEMKCNDNVTKRCSQGSVKTEREPEARSNGISLPY